MTTTIIVALVVRVGLVLLFLPFSALDKIFGFDHAVLQAQSAVKSRPVAIALILVGLLVEIECTLGVVTGIAEAPCRLLLFTSPSGARPCGPVRPRISERHPQAAIR